MGRIMNEEHHTSLVHACAEEQTPPVRPELCAPVADTIGSGQDLHNSYTEACS